MERRFSKVTKAKKDDICKFPTKILPTLAYNIKQQLYTYHMANYQRILIIVSMFLIPDKQNLHQKLSK